MGLDFTTYWFGAGASANSVSPVSGLHKDFKLVHDNLIEAAKNVERHNELEIRALADRVNYYYQDAFNQSSGGTRLDSKSVDTYAQNARSNPRVYKEFKFILSVVILLIQELKGPDPRYSHLIANNANNEGLIDPRIRFVTWNYDYNIEEALLERIGMYDNATWESVENSIFKSTKDLNGVTIPAQIKLNGSCNSYYSTAPFDSEPDRLIDIAPNSKASKNRFLKSAINLSMTYIAMSDNDLSIESGLAFFWEKSEIQNKRFEDAKRIFENTKSLVIVGYSFPQENQEIDQELISKLPDGANIFIQDPDFQELSDKFKFLGGKRNSSYYNLQATGNCDQFYKPGSYFKNEYKFEVDPSAFIG